MHSFYFAVPYGYKYAWHLVSYDKQSGVREPTADEVLEVQHNIAIDFVCNSFGGVPVEGVDLYEATVSSEEEEFLFFLKTGFKKVDLDNIRLPERVKLRLLRP